MDDKTGQADQVHGPSGADPQDAAEQAPALVTVPYKVDLHRGSDFLCCRSDRIQNFFKDECERLLEKNYCRVFVLPDPEDPSHIWGYYTLSPGLVEKGEVSTQDQKRVMRGLPIPMFLVGFLGRDDGVSKEMRLGGVLLHDAALRLRTNPDIATWGIYLDAENEGVANWYETKMRFKRTKSKPLVMYAPLKVLLPG